MDCRDLASICLRCVCESLNIPDCQYCSASQPDGAKQPRSLLDPGALIERSILCFHRAAGLNDNSKLCEASPRAAQFIVFLIAIAIKHFGKRLQYYTQGF